MENNEKIAIFLGAKEQNYSGSGKEYELYGLVECIDDGEEAQHFFTLKEMKFETSWDWLMPVVNKCSQLEDSLDLETVFELWVFVCCDITAVHGMVIKFIDWYNNEYLLEELHQLVELNQDRSLTSTEKNKYLEIWETLQRNNIEIPFGVEI